MKAIFGRLLLGIGLLLATVCAQAQDYTLAVGDVVKINVFDEPDLSIAKVQISETGKIQFPPLGEIQATGRTTTQLQQAITAGLMPDYLVDARVTVTIEEYRPYFMTGEVAKPGSYPYQPGLTLLQAITIAGGPTDRASATKMFVSNGESKTPMRVGSDYKIKAGDTIKIEESFF